MKLNKFIAVASIVLSSQLFGHTHSLSESTHKMTASVLSESFHQTLKELTHLDIDIAGVDIKRNVVDVLLTDEDYELLSSKNYSLVIKEVTGVTRAPDERYQTPESVKAYLEQYNSKYPNLTKLVSIGKSL